MPLVTLPVLGSCISQRTQFQQPLRSLYCLPYTALQVSLFLSGRSLCGWHFSTPQNTGRPATAVHTTLYSTWKAEAGGVLRLEASLGYTARFRLAHEMLPQKLQRGRRGSVRSRGAEVAQWLSAYCSSEWPSLSSQHPHRPLTTP